MPEQNNGPRYSNQGHPYTNSGRRYNESGEYRRENTPFQFPWWAIGIAFATGAPLGFILIGLNIWFKKSAENQPYPPAYREPVRQDSVPVYSLPDQPAKEKKKKKKKEKTEEERDNVAILGVIGTVLLIIGIVSLPEGLYWLSDALMEGGHYWSYLFEEAFASLGFLAGGAACLFGAGKMRTNRRMRKKIKNIVGDADTMYIEDIAASLNCGFDKCCKHLENCIDAGVFGEGAYLDMRSRSLIVRGPAPRPTPKPAPAPASKPNAVAETDRYQQILDKLRRVNDAIPDREMSEKIDRLEQVSARIFEQAKTDPDKLPRMRKFMDYYLPTALKLLNTYAELEAQGVEGENIRDSKRRIERAMDTLVKAFENQLDQLFQSDALDVSADIDVMENMLRADGLAEDNPFKLGVSAPSAPQPPKLE